MKKTLVIAVFFMSTLCSAQDNFFQIIAFKGEVLLNSLSVTCGQKIDKPEQILSITKGSYASVLTSTGYAFQLGRGKHKVKSILNQTLSNLTRIKNSRGTGAVNRKYPGQIKVLSVDDYDYKYLGGDTLTIIWQKKNKTAPYTVSLRDLYDRILLDTIASENVITVNVEDKLKDGGLLFRINSQKLSSGDKFLKIFPAHQDFRFDVSRVSGMSFIERELLLAGLCEIYNLYYDQIHHLHNVYAYSKKTGIKISHPYYLRMLKEHEFEKYFISQP
jgi:hypothetical protein